MLSNNPIAQILQNQPLVVLDGALATELERRGCDLHDLLWSAKILLESPEIIRQIHQDYFEAGADCAITASYQATFEGFAQRGYNANQAASLMHLAVQLAIEARDQFWIKTRGFTSRLRPFVAASVGPYGAFLSDGSEYHGNYEIDEDALVAFHRPRMAVLATSGADMLACETIPSLLEARALLRLLPEFPTMSAWVSFTCRDDLHTAHGEVFADCVAEISAHPQVAAVGVNCTAPHFLPSLISAARPVTTKPILVYPNSGEVYDAITKTWEGQVECDAFAQQAQIWYTAGARGIGGCCRTTPAHIRELALTLRPTPH